jgi:hypothetical protein
MSYKKGSCGCNREVGEYIYGTLVHLSPSPKVPASARGTERAEAYSTFTLCQNMQFQYWHPPWIG